MPVTHALRRSSGKTVMPLENFARVADAAGAAAAERRALDDLFSATYEELRRLAASVRRTDPGATLNPTELVNQAWLKLASSPQFHAASNLHFKRVAARAMRQLLIESARRRHAGKRGGDSVRVVTFDEAVHRADVTGRDLLRLDAVLDELAAMNPRQAQVVEYRYFGGIDVGGTAVLLDVSEATILRDWRAAKAWLACELQRER